MAESESKPQDAVIVRSAQKCYSKGQPNVLNGLNMTVEKGCIYGLLGASGCGKTTLLSCIVGVRKLDSGDISVLGGKPGDKNSGIPGPRVGYMPQDISLVPEMSIIGSLYYFGRINGLEDSVIDESYRFYSNLLELPAEDRLIKNLSGGQQRRVSLAAALIHKPELLILDEPTVGLDSILREKIWNFLVKVAKKDGVTIIITTHYIEEAKQADRIGLLRCGQLLAETTPEALLHEFDCSTLEEAFVILSQKQEDNIVNSVAENRDDGVRERNDATTSFISELPSQNDLCCSTNSIIDNDKEVTAANKVKSKRKRYSHSLFSKIFRALMIKNLLQILRNPGAMMFGFVSPVIQTTLFYLSVSDKLKGLAIAVVNDEAGNCDNGNLSGSIFFDPGDEWVCQYQNISCRFLHEFNETIFVKKYYDTVDEATVAVQKGKAAGVMYFMSNFSSAFQLRRDDFTEMEDGDIDASQIHMRMDMSDSQISLWLKKKLIDRFIEIHGDIVSHCNITKKFADNPIYFEDPIYGSKDPKYSDYAAPGILISLCFFFATAISSTTMISDQAEGVWDRSLVQGVKTWEILISHILTEMIMITIQVVLVLLVTFAYFQIPCKGPFGYAIAIIWLSSFLGMCYGFLISCVCSNYTLSHMMAVGTFYPIVLLNGCMWPVEAMPTFLYYFSLLIPATVPTFTLRSIMEKGYPMSNPEIYSGFIVAIGWSAIFIVCCVVYLRKKSSL